jgi:hypothetical protein
MKTTRTLAVAAAIVAAAGSVALGAGTAFADQTGKAVDVPAGQTVCADLATDGSSGHAQVVADQPVQFTVYVNDGGGFTLVSASDSPTTLWRAELPGETGYVVRVVRACAQNPGDASTSAFLTIETDEDQVTPAPAVAADNGSTPADAPEGPAPVVVDDGAGATSLPAVTDLASQVESQVDALFAQISAAFGA